MTPPTTSRFLLLACAVFGLFGEALGQEFSKPGVYETRGTYKLDQDGEQLCGVGGIQRWRRQDAVVDRTKATVLLHEPDDAPAIAITGDGCDVERLNLWRDFYNGERLGGTAITIAGWGKHSLRRVGLAGWDVGIHCLESNHCDESRFEQIHVNNCRVFFKNDEQQSSGCKFECIYVYGKGETVFDLDKGGNYEIGTLVINEPRLIFRLRSTSSNTCTFTIHNLKVDNNAAGWRLVQMDRPGPINLRVRGHVGQDAKPGEKPIVIPDATTRKFTPRKDYQVLDVELWGAGGESVVWRPTLTESRP